MPNIRKSVITQTEVIPPPNPADAKPEGIAVSCLADFYATLTPEDIDNGLTYLYQIEPPITKNQGEPAYVEKYKQVIDEDVVRSRIPMATQASIIFKWVTGPRKPPKTYRFALVPQPQQPTFNVNPTTQIAVTGSEGKVIELADKLAEKLARAQSPDALKAAHDQAMGLVNDAYKIALTNAMAGRSEQRTLTQELADLRAAGFLPSPGVSPQADPTEAIVLRLKSEGIIKTQPEEDFADKIKKVADTAALLGFQRITGVGGSEGWKDIFARNIPELTKGLMYVADKFVEGLAMSRAQAAPAANLAPKAANGGRAQPGAAGSPAAAAPTPEAVLDAFIKTKLVEMAAAGFDAEEVIAWIEITADGILGMIRGKPLPMVLQYFAGDSILKQAVATDAGKAWLEGVLKEVNGENKTHGSAG